ncbi:MAG: M20/M25/M40 family metallo-hydrolase [Flavobacteriaceae bacterium]|jgi:Zn-dependent M28 family amino/carboxypeptidase|nr:M20/M25/M40 family metallo-hydrolase [Flavobacteriaceae bacterium]
MRYFVVALAALLVGCSSVQDKKSSSVEVNSAQIKNTLYYLASDELKGRDTGSEGGMLAAKYLSNELKKYGIAPLFKSYNDTITQAANAWNVVGVIPGSDKELAKEVIVLGAHYDHIGIIEPIDGDAIANGANDNAAGTAIALEVARNVKLSNPKRTIVIAFFTGEEKGLWGAEHLSSRMKKEGIQVVGMLNYEMLGIPMKRSYMAYLTGYDMSTMAEKINEFAGKALVGKLDEAEKYQLFKRSDNYPFYQVFGVPCQSFSSFDFTNSEYYHHVKDEAHLMDLEFMTSFTKEMIPVVVKIANMPKGELRNK